ncbi:MAG: FAD/NAD(P)-binding oxidoreductase [Dehalococcoidales bacterium]|jgi:sulfide:quinone oxidoreductase|nr:FAD/NAD(P)-binding oxidoreductase [Dehalococcoidales bacterium]MDP6631928.1 FAD/NAD(P)-binding oxidoreductase [Dehalococcoidales bacterium]
MAGKIIVILGGGFGGLIAAKQLRNALPAEHRIVVVEKKSTFSLSPFNMRFMAGEIKDRHEVERPLSALANTGIEWVHEEIMEIDSTGRKVRTSSGTLEGDYLIVALGAEKDGSSIPGFSESAYDLYGANEALLVNKPLLELDEGRAIVLVCRSPFSCPAAPYEAAFLMDSIFRSRGNRDRVDVAVYTPEGKPMGGAGPAVGDALIGMLTEHNIGFNPQQKLQRIEKGKIVFEDGEAAFDLLVGIPPHAAPKVVREAGLTDEGGWITVEIDTLETIHPGIYAIGDVTSIKQPNPTGLSLPKAGVFADEQARVVAANIAAEIRGKDKSRKFDGKGFCYIEVGDGQAAYGSGNFYGYPGPTVYLEPPSRKFHEERKKLEMDQLADLV